MTLNEGDRILLTVRNKYYANESNPVKSSKYECSGIIEAIAVDGRAQVLWDNGYRNVYEPTDLSLHSDLSENNPNRTYKMNKRDFGKQTSSYFGGEIAIHAERGSGAELIIDDSEYFASSEDNDFISLITEDPPPTKSSFEIDVKKRSEETDRKMKEVLKREKHRGFSPYVPKYFDELRLTNS